MKHDDLLLEATRALRDELADTEPASLTRGRIMQSLHDNRRKRATRLTVLVPLAAIFIGGTAWATAGGYTRVATAMVAFFAGSPASDSPAAEAPGPLGPMPRAEAPPPVDDVADDPQPADAPSPADQLPLADAPPPKIAPPVTPSSPTAAADPGRDLYEKAHHAHFAQKDPAAALAAWEAYLAEAPGGPFATEATYNRALCLVRLGRTEQAKAALTPFAEGRYGSYRQSESKQLLEALAP